MLISSPAVVLLITSWAILSLKAQITYLDAVEGSAGNTFATGSAQENTTWINPDVGAASDDDQWGKRTFANNGTLFQALHNGNTIPELTTRISGLPDGTYDVWVFFWDGPNSNQWTISAGLESGNTTTYSFDGPGNTTEPVAAATLAFTASSQPMTTEDPRIMYGVLLGQQTVAGGSVIDVYIDNTAAGGSNNRTWYDGVGYAPLVPDEDNDGDGLPDSFEQRIINADGNDDIDGLEDVMGTGASPATTDFDQDDSSDAEEFARGTDPLDPDSDNDGLVDGVESNSGEFVDLSDPGTDPLNPDTDHDGTPDGAETFAGTDPTDSDSNLHEALVAVDFNCSSVLGSPSQSRFRIISGSATQAENAPTYTKRFGPYEVTVSRPDQENFEFRGANGDGSRAIPGGDLSRSFLVSDFLATRAGQIDFEITNLPAGNYVFRSFHLEPFTGSAQGFAQGADLTTPNLIVGSHRRQDRASIQPTSLGSAGLNTTFIDDGQIPMLSFLFEHDGSSPAVISLRSAIANGNNDRFLFLNGFQLFQSPQ